MGDENDELSTTIMQRQQERLEPSRGPLRFETRLARAEEFQTGQSHEVESICSDEARAWEAAGDALDELRAEYRFRVGEIWRALEEVAYGCRGAADSDVLARTGQNQHKQRS